MYPSTNNEVYARTQTEVNAKTQTEVMGRGSDEGDGGLDRSQKDMHIDGGQRLDESVEKFLIRL